MTSPKEAAQYLANEAGISLNGHAMAEWKLRRWDLTNITPREVQWLWYKRLPRGKFCLLGGDPGLGKSYMTLDIAARISLGSEWPDHIGSAPIGNTLIISVEDGMEDTIRPRLDLLGADLSRIRCIEPIVDSDTKTAGLNLADHLMELEQEIIDYKASLLILDPVLAFTGLKADTHRASDVRSILGPLANVADRTLCTVLGIMHLNKRSTELNSLYRISGSGDFGAAARSVQLVGKHPENEDRRVLAPVKMNLSAKPVSLEFGFTPEGEFTWYGPTTLEANQILQMVDAEEKSARESAKDFLFDILQDRPWFAKDVWEAADANGISKNTLRRAASEIGVIISQGAPPTGKRGSPGWIWKLLPQEPGNGPENGPEESHTQNPLSVGLGI